ncbi:hypothetical protein EVG20_g5085 [Dentipellis fragilis]|uniref:Fe2OG dioxygenase domain-containing protein n=1 Tax=Dentipellis fragilis TaxID=205917 RepID=A0A4Y9YUV9_9AGAM|nr:hypothetical protein EVG20_g5085 [Dentipellis fragilis]
MSSQPTHPTRTTPEVLKPLRDAITHKPSFVSGTLPLDPQSFLLCHGGVGGGSAWHCLDLAYASAEPVTAGKLDSSSFMTPIVPERTALIDLVRGGLLEGIDATRPIKVELYKLNVYSEGSFFKAHQDTPRSESMFGSLVLVFPTPHKGGALVLREDEQEWTFDSAIALARQAGDTPSIGYIAFFSDVEHEVLRVESGHRVTITFNLYYADIETDSDAPATPALEAGTLLDDPTFLPDGGTLAFGMRHVYPIKDTLKHIPKLLKGSDALVWRISEQLGLTPQVYLHYQEKHMWHGMQLALVPMVPKLDGDCYEDMTLVERLRQDFDAIVIYSRSSWMDIDERINWVTKLRALSRVKSPYMAYGNEAHFACAYGDVCLIVRVGRPGSRTEIVKRQPEKRQF